MPDDRTPRDLAALPAAGPGALQRLIADAMAGDGDLAARRWAASGAMALTGPADQPPDIGPARVALAMDALAADIARTSALVGTRVDIDGATLLGERAAIAGLNRRGAVSCGGASRLLPTTDGGTVALSLAREDDWQLLPALFALVGATYSESVTGDDGWEHVAAAVAGVAAGELIAAAVELGLPAARLGEADAASDLVEFQAAPASPTGAPHRAPWTVVDLSSLWAGPLCANLLGLAGARVVKVESPRRPDGARRGPPAFFDLLHGGHESVALDLAAAEGQLELRRLLTAADVVIEASRPRALAALNASYEDLRAAGWEGVWLSITGHGRRGPDADRVAFGDDAAVAGGLVGGLVGGTEPTRFTFCADAIADPATGLIGAAAVLRCLAAGRSGLIAVSLASTAAHLALGVHANPWVEMPAGLTVAAPQARLVRDTAPPLAGASVGSRTLPIRAPSTPAAGNTVSGSQQ
jgi:crotonobetainyl-CoA:carnitine CoA-transferase CaiB-like acyl-CoA transferase